MTLSKRPELKTFYFPVELVEIECQHCDMKFAVLALNEDGTFWLQGNEETKLYCPYCGEIAYSLNLDNKG